MRNNQRPHPDYVAHNVYQPMNRKELQFPQMVDVEGSIYPFFLNMETEISPGNHVKK